MKAMNRQVGIGVLWNLLSLFMSRGASTLFTVFLARLLAPDAFGLIAMAAVVLELANTFVNSGLGAALVRSKSVSDVDLCTVFYTNLLLSGLAYSLLFLSAPFISSFYSRPDLTVLIQVTGIIVFFNALKVVQTAILSRRMDFKSQMKANTIGVVVSGSLAVTAASFGWGVWSLVLQMLTASLVSSVLLWLATHWRPEIRFSTASFSRLFFFGRNLLIEGLLSVLYQNSYVLVIGRFFSAELTGLYFLSKKVSNLVSQQLTNAVQQATFPVLATLQDENKTLRRKYRQIVQLMMFVIAPVMALLAALAQALFSVLFDDRWNEAVPYLQLLCVVGALYPLHAMNINLLNVKGRSDLVLKVGLVKKLVNLTLLIMAVPYGVLGIVFSQVVGSFFALIPNSYFSSRLVGYSLANQLNDVFKPFIAAMAAGYVSWIFIGNGDGVVFIELVGGASVGLAVYIFLSIIIKSEPLVALLNKLVLHKPSSS